jgi:N,N'-diacetyllegionaminate synthase
VKLDFLALSDPVSPTYMIAEIGVNHNGNYGLAREMILAAGKAGADAVKFQTFSAEALVVRDTPKVEYQRRTGDPAESQFDMLQRLELKREYYPPLIDLCLGTGLDFISTPYDLGSADFLKALEVVAFKTASADLIDLPLQRRLASFDRPVLVATGMASIDEIDETAQIYRTAGNSRFALLHCVSNYPCSDESLNLRAIEVLKSRFRVPVGYSDHSLDPGAASLAVALGAKIIEKHFTLSTNLDGPDHKASSTPEEFSNLVRTVRRAERMLGRQEKRCQDEELQMRQMARKSIVLKKNLRRGDQLTEDAVTLKRTGTGLPPKHLPELLRRSVRRDLPADHIVQQEDML